MKSKTPFWKPLLLTLILLAMFVSTAALFDAAALSKDAFYYVCGAVNLLVYIGCLYFAYKALLLNHKSVKTSMEVTETCYEALYRFHQVRKLPNKTFKTRIVKDSHTVTVRADKEKDVVELVIEGE